MSSHEFLMEHRLRELDPGLHRRFTDTVFALQRYLTQYQLIFPTYTDHSDLHSLTVIRFCNELAGDQVLRMNADELYILLMGCYLHDTGMGITDRNYEEFKDRIDFGAYPETHDMTDKPVVIRDFHHEFSACFIRKYAMLLDFPSPEHLRAVVAVARGHRRTDLLDEETFPRALALPRGNTVCLPYLSALIRLADEIDVAAERNPVLLYDMESMRDAVWQKAADFILTRSIRDLEITPDAFTLKVRLEDESLRGMLDRLAAKMRITLEDCRRAVNGRTPFTITQSQVFVRELPANV